MKMDYSPPTIARSAASSAGRYGLLLLVGLGLSLKSGMLDSAAYAADPTEQDYYAITPLEIPEGVVLEVGGFQMLPDGRLAVCSRRGEIWMVENPLAATVPASSFQRFAHGLHEPLSLDYADGWLYVTQRPEISRLKDTDGDGEADQFETVNDDWGISGDYHEYAFGSKADKQGDRWVVLCLTGSFSSSVPYRGWCVRVTAEGEMTPTTSGVRSPGGIGSNAEGHIFYTDNQGPWNGACALKHLIPGKFVGHPGGFQWYELAESVLGKKPQEPKTDSRMMVEAKKIEQLEPPAILFPYPAMGQAASGIACDTTGGKFGPFENQLFVADQAHSTVMRVYLEKIQGHYQGACFPFRSGFASGNVGVEMTDSGAMFVGGTNRGWGARGPKPFAVERLDWTGKVPFEIHEMRALPGGFELTFTESAAVASLEKIENYTISSYTYIYRADYGSPPVDQTTPTITSAKASADGRSVTLEIAGLQEGHVHELHASGVRSPAGHPLLHDAAYYTLNYLAK